MLNKFIKEIEILQKKEVILTELVGLLLRQKYSTQKNNEERIDELIKQVLELEKKPV